MRNLDLAKDYLLRARGRLKVVDTLLAEHMWADVVRECQEIVEPALKGHLRHHLEIGSRKPDPDSHAGLPIALRDARSQAASVRD